MTTTEQAHKAPGWSPGRPKFRPLALVVAWLVSASALLVAAWIVPGAAVNGFLGALAAAVAIAALNAVVPPILAALRLPLMVLTGLVLILIADALMLLAADRITDHDLQIDSFWSALGVAFVTAAVTVVLDIVLGTNDDDTYTIRVIQRIARRSGGRTVTDAPGIVFLEIDGLALPVLQRATRDGSAPNMARWLAEGTTASPNGRPTSPRRPAPARPASCSARTTTSRPFAGWRRRPRSWSPARAHPTAPRSSGGTPRGRDC